MPLATSVSRSSARSFGISFRTSCRSWKARSRNLFQNP